MLKAKRQMWKSVLSFLLCLAMLLSTIQITTFAASENEGVESPAPDAEAVTEPTAGAETEPEEIVTEPTHEIATEPTSEAETGSEEVATEPTAGAETEPEEIVTEPEEATTVPEEVTTEPTHENEAEGDVSDTETEDGDGAAEESGEHIFLYQDKTVTVKAYVSAEAGIPKDAVFRADKLEKNSEKYKVAYETVLNALNLSENERLEFVPYDVYFLVDGERMEPTSGLVRVEMTFAENVLDAALSASLAQEAAAVYAAVGTGETELPVQEGPLFAVHIKQNGQVERIEDQSKEEEKLVFDVASFSVMGPARIFTVSSTAAVAYDPDATVVYALYYASDKKLVFQYDDIPESGKSATVYKVDLTKKYTESSKPGWTDTRTMIPSNAKTITFRDRIAPFYLDYWFYGMYGASQLDLTNLDTSRCVSMNHAFSGLTYIKGIDVSHLDTSKVEDMGYCFSNCAYLQTLDVSSWDVSSVTNMEYMFNHLYWNAITLDVSAWEVDNVTNMAGMFKDCKVRDGLDVSGWNVSGVTDMSDMFNGCTLLTKLDVAGWDVSHVTNMANMFKGCTKLTDLDISDWEVGQVTDMSYIFSGCSVLPSVDISSWDLGNVTNMSHAFENCKAMTAIDVAGRDFSHVADMSYIFSGCTALTDIDVSQWKLTGVSDLSYAFNGCTALSSLDVGNWDLSTVTKLSHIFAKCTSLTTLNVVNWVLDNATDMSSIFEGCTALTSLETGNWNLSGVKDLSSAFSGCVMLTDLGENSWNLSSVQNIASIFSNCSRLTTLNTESWGLGNATNISSAFQGCGALLVLDASGWDTGKVTNMANVFSMGPTTIKLGEKFQFKGTNAFDAGSNWTWVEAGQNYTAEELYAQYNASMAGTYTKAGIMGPGGKFYAIRYPDGELSFQYNAEADSSKEAPLNVWIVDSSARYTNETLPWYSVRTSITSVNFRDMIIPTSMDYWFAGMTKLDVTTIQAPANLDTSHVKTTNHLFASTNNGTYWKTLDLSAWDLRNVTDMAYMFYNTYVTTLDLGDWDLSNVTNMSYAFYQCSNLTALDTSNWDLNKVVDMSYAFRYSKKLTELNGDNWGLSSVKDMSYAFSDCEGLISIGMANWTLDEVTTLYFTFYNDKALKQIDAGNWKLDKLTTFSWTFENCTSLTTVGDTSNWNLSQVTTLLNVFNNCPELTALDAGSWDLRKVTTMANAFYGCKKLTTIGDVGNWELDSLTTLSATFYNCSSLKELNVGDWEFPKLTTLAQTFYNCYALTTLDTSAWDVSKVTSMSGTFYGCNGLEILDLSSWNNLGMTGTTATNNMFYLGPRKIVLGENFKFVGTNAFDLSNWVRESTKEVFLSTDLCTQYNGAEMADTYYRGDIMAPGGIVYALFYDSGELVLQYTATPDPAKGPISVSNIWTVDTSAVLSSSYGTAWYSRRTSVTSVSFRDPIIPTSMTYWFADMSGLQTFNSANLDTSHVTNLQGVFSKAAAPSLDLTAWDVSSVTRLSSAFAGSTIGKLDVSGWNTGSVTFMNSMFSEANIEALDLSTWDFSSVTTMASAFNKAKALTTLNLGAADMRRVTTMANAFEGCTSLVNINSSGWMLEDVTTMFYAFYGCTALANVDTGSWDLNNVTTMSYAFYNCGSLAGLNAAGWGLSKVTDMSRAFSGCKKMVSLGAGSWDLSNVTTLSYTFNECNALTELDTSAWGLGKLTDMSYTFYRCSGLVSLNTRDWDMSHVTTMAYAFSSCGALTGLDTTNWILSKVKTMSSAFSGCSKLELLDTTNWDLGSATTMSSTFSSCASLTALNTGSWNLNNVTTMDSTFYRCTMLSTLDTASWELPKVTNTRSMFSGCTSLKSLEAGNWQLEKVQDTSFMFNECNALTSLGEGSWHLSAVTDMNTMFYNCKSLATLDTSNWDLSKVTNMKQTFYYCSALTSLEAGGWGLNKLTSMTETFYYCSKLRTLGEGSWNLKPSSMERTFTGCSSLEVLDASNWDTTGTYYDYRTFGTLNGLEEVTLGPKSETLSNKHFIIPNGDANTKWVLKGTEQFFTPAELRAYQEANPIVQTYYKVRPVVFDAGAGLAVPSMIEEWWPGKVVETLPTATRRGADFAGWWTDMVEGTEIHDGEALMQDTYYAHWNEYHYTLILDANCGNGEQKRIELSYSDIYRLSSTEFTRNWYEISGWNTMPTGDGIRFGANEEILQMTEEDGGVYYLYAQWTYVEDMITVTFDTQGGSYVPDLRMARYSAIGRLPVSVRSGYTFMGWRMGSVDGEFVEPTTEIRDNVTLFAEWERDLVVTFNYNGRASEDNFVRTVPYQTAVGPLPEDPGNGRFGWLAGWFTEPVGGRKITEDELITEDVTFYAHWGWRPKFNANGGTFMSSPLLEVQESNWYVIEEFPEVVYDGYKLVGWFLADGVTEVHPGDSIDLSQGAEIIAFWERANTVKIILNPNGGNFDGSTTAKIYEVYADRAVGELARPVRSGYEFLGWLDMANPEGPYCTKDTIFTQDTTLMAQWREQNCTVTFEANASDARFASNATKKTVKIPAGDTLDTLPGCKRKDYVLVGWYPNEDGSGEPLTKDTVINESVTYYAKWEPFKTTEDNDLHQYTYGAEWTNASNADADNSGYNLEFHPSGSNEQTAMLHVYFELNNAFGKVTTLPKGAVYIKVPKYVFQDWNGRNIGTNDIAGVLAVYPTVGSNIFSYMDMGDYFILRNNREISTAGIEITISYTVDPRNVRGGATDADGRYVDGYPYYQNTFTVDFAIDETPNDDVEPDTWLSKQLSIEMHTKLEPTPRKSFVSFVYDWDDDWGDRPADAADYFYIVWTLSQGFSGNQSVSSYRWSEDDTVHDGTIVYMNTSGGKVVTKHPASLLEDIPATGRTFYNEAILTETWRSGYVDEQRVSAVAELRPTPYDIIGEFDKDRAGNARVIEGGQEDILDDQKELTLTWALHYDGGAKARPEWNDDTKTYYTPERTIWFQDGAPGDLLYSSGRAAAPDIWVPNTGNVELVDDDYYFTTLKFTLTEYDAKCYGDTWTPMEETTDTSLFKPIHVYLRYKDSEDFLYYTSVNYAQQKTLTLPADVVGFEIRYSTSYYWTKFDVTASIKLKPNTKITALVQNDVDSVTTSLIKNIGRWSVSYEEDGGESNPFIWGTNRTGDRDLASKVIYELNVSKNEQYTYKYSGSTSAVAMDPINGVEDIPMLLEAYNLNRSGRTKYIRTGVFYDLLPAGTSVDASTVVLLTSNPASTAQSLVTGYNTYKNRGLNAAYYDVRFEDNYQGSGRTMMTIQFAVPEGVKTSRVYVMYLLRNTYKNVVENGVSLENDVAFVNTTGGRIKPEYTYGSRSSFDVNTRQFFDQLQAENEGFITYAKAYTSYKEITAYSWGFEKLVKTGVAYKVDDTTLPGNDYTYWLSYGQSADSANRGFVLYDVLEYGAQRRDEEGGTAGAEFQRSAWTGTLKSISVSITSEDENQVGCNWKIYYSTRPREEFHADQLVSKPEDNPMFDLSNEAVWSTTRPAGEITAIAIDFTEDVNGEDFVLKGKASIDVYITMEAPVDENDFGKKTYNEALMFSMTTRTEGATITPQYSDAEVELKDVNPGLEKESDPETGTAENPKIVEKDTPITYTLKITNPEKELTVYDIVVVDEVPEGLHIMNNDIMVNFGPGTPSLNISVSPRVTMVKEGQKLTFNISSLLPGETMYLVIPTMVTVSQKSFDNKAIIPEVNGLEKEIESETTHHRVYPTTYATLQIAKVVEGNRYKLIEAGEFNFQAVLTQIDGTDVSSSMSEAQTYTGSTTGASGWVSIGPINYKADSLDHTYTYRITEITPTENRDPHIVYWNGALYADVTVEDNGESVLVTKVTYRTEDGQQLGEDIPTVVNYYMAESDFLMRISKVIDGDRKKPIEQDEFSFTAVLVDNKTREPLEGDKAVTLHSATNAYGGVVFSVHYTQDDIGKVYTYQITEDEGEDPTIIYSREKIYVEVRISDGDETSLGNLWISATYYTLDDRGNRVDIDVDATPTITNTYNVFGLYSIALEGRKTLEGSPLAEGQFAFAVKDADGSVLQVAKNDAEGRIEFKPLRYTQEDAGQTYVYTITEVNDAESSLKGVTYDETVYTLTVSVEDSGKGNGSLIITTTLTGGDLQSPVVNVITEPEGAVSGLTFSNHFEGSVVLHKTDETGNVLAGAKFQLYVRDANNQWVLYTEDHADGVYITDADGLVKVTGLSTNDYYFVETEAPEGYVLETEADGSPKHYEFTIGVEEGPGAVKDAAVDVILYVINLSEEEPGPGGSEPTSPTKPAGDIPKTGDSSHLGIWAMLLMLSTVGIIVMAWKELEDRKSRRK